MIRYVRAAKMKTNNIYILIVMVFIGLSTVSCSIPYHTGITVKKVENIIAAELKVGDEKEVILAFFERHTFFKKYKLFGIEKYTRIPRFSKFSKAYRGIILNVSNYIVYNTDITVVIYVDDQKRFLRAEVKAVHTGL